MNALVYPRTIGVKQVQRDHADNEFYILSYVISLYLLYVFQVRVAKGLLRICPEEHLSASLDERSGVSTSRSFAIKPIEWHFISEHVCDQLSSCLQLSISA